MNVSDRDGETVAHFSIPGPEEVSVRTIWLIVIVAILLDLGTTALGFHLGETEGNPLVAFGIENFGHFGHVVMKLLAIAVGVAVMSRAKPHVPEKLYRLWPLLLAIPWLSASIANLYVLATGLV